MSGTPDVVRAVRLLVQRSVESRAVWRVVCIGPGPGDVVRRVTDRGPILTSKEQADAIAAWLRSTGLYEIVHVEQPSKIAEAQLSGGSAGFGNL